ncbi:MAG: hypothetical protein RLZZ161_1392 [Bacteroidota bacterium]
MKTGLVWKVLKWILAGACVIWVISLLTGSIPKPEAVWSAVLQIPWYWHFAALLSATANWWLEALKWQLLVSNLENLSLGNAAKGLFAGAAANNVIPFRVGEFLGRVMYLKEENRPAALLNNYFGATCQTLVTLIVGIPAAYALLGNEAEKYGRSSVYYILPFLLLLGIAWIVVKSRNKKPAWLEKWLMGFRHFSGRQILGTLGLSFFRYLVFGGFYALFIINFQLADFSTALTGVACIFFIQTFTPGMIYTDAAVRLSLPLLIFSISEPQKPLLLGIAVINYFYNVLLPALIGIIVFILHRWKPHSS